MVVPLYDDDPLKLPVPPYVTWGLIAINAVVFLIQITSQQAEWIIAVYGVTPALITGSSPSAASLHIYSTLLTGMFLHQGWGHLLGNMLYLYVFGDDIEEALGRWRFVIFYVLSGVAASLIYVAVNSGSGEPMIGASGAISGVLAAYLLLRPCAKVTVLLFYGTVRIRAMWVIGFWVALQLFDILTSPGDNVAYSAHIGGLLAGALLFLVLRPRNVQLFECIEEPREKSAN